MTARRLLLMIGPALLAAGCQGKPASVTSAPVVDVPPPLFEQGSEFGAKAGPYVAALTSRPAAAGGFTLDVVFQAGRSAKPVALPLEGFDGQALVTDGGTHDLKFVPAPANERPADEKPGTCSHFLVHAPWLKETDRVDVTARPTINGKPVTVEWKGFPAKG